MEKAGLLDLAIAPLQWLERSRGRKRKGLILLYVSAISMVGFIGWRELSLWRLPDIGEPFDATKLGTVSVADADNAIPLYESAGELIKPFRLDFYGLGYKDWDKVDWAKLDPAIHQWVVESRPAFDLWLRAADRADALVIQPKDMTISTILSPVMTIRELSQVGILEGYRLESTGDLDGAWRCYRAALRSSRHIGRHGGINQRGFGNSLLRIVKPAIGRWLENPAVTPAMLRRAIEDVETCRSMTPPLSETVRVEYFATRDVLNHTENWKNWGIDGTDREEMWYNHFPIVPMIRRFVMREPERSLRVHRLITAGLLAQCDRPRSDRPRLFSDQLMIYQVDAQTPTAVAAISPVELARWTNRSAYPAIAPNLNFMLSMVEVEPGIFDTIRIRMAERAYEIERGRPPKTYGDLLGSYLKALPDGIEPGDAMTAPADPKSP